MHRAAGLVGLGTGRRRTKLVALTTFLVLAAGAVAIAAPSGVFNPGSGGPTPGIVAVGPVNAADGFPDWYRDTNGVDLAPCNDPQQNLPLTLDASASMGGAKYEWAQESGAPMALNGDTTSSKLTFLYPKTAMPIVMRVRVRRSDDTGTGSAFAPSGAGAVSC